MGKNWFRIIGRVFVLLLAVYGALSWLSQFHLEPVGPAKAEAYWENTDGVRVILRADDARSPLEFKAAYLKLPGYHLFDMGGFANLHRGRFTRAMWINECKIKIYLSPDAALTEDTSHLVSGCQIVYVREPI